MNASKSGTIDLFDLPIFPSSQGGVPWSLDNVPADVIVGKPGIGKSAALARFVRELDHDDATDEQVRS